MAKLRKMLALLLALVLVVGLFACEGEESPITVDEKGYVTWIADPQAVKYECVLVDDTDNGGEPFYLTEPGYQLEEGYSLHVQAIHADGSTGDWMISQRYGKGKYDALRDENGELDLGAYPNVNYNLRWDALERFELLSAIRWDTLRTDEDGLLTFEADGPHGVMRFAGSGVTAENGCLTFQPRSRIWALDAIGRICGYEAVVSQNGHSENGVFFSGGYTFTDATSVDRHEELMYVWGSGVHAENLREGGPVEMMDWQPNFVIVGGFDGNEDAFTLSALTVYYDTATFHTGIRSMWLDSSFYGTYLEGDRYDPGREVYDLESELLTFYLCAVPEVLNELERYDPKDDPDRMSRAIIAFTTEQFRTGDLRLADGTAVERSTPLQPNMTIDVTVGDFTLPVALSVYAPFSGAQTMSQLAPYGFPGATGDMNALLVPVAWQDQADRANDENLLALKQEVGRVAENGTVTDYSGKLGDRFSLSEYYDIASYGKLKITTFVTDWFVAPFDYAQYETVEIDNEAFLDAAYAWLLDSYPDMDWTIYDKDGNGYFDALMFVNVGTSNADSFMPGAFSGGAHQLLTYNGGAAGTPEKPTINGYLNVNADRLGDRTLVHEFAHNLGLIDYYDVTYSGIDAVGRFDMQSGSYGDWNAYSKYAAGWLEPTVVELAPGETAEYTLGALCDTASALVIPTGDDFNGPFDEYILVDLFRDGGVNVYDTADFQLTGVSGVRIYHINAKMETHTEESNGTSYTFGTPMRVNSYEASGLYHVELIQAGGDNTFTDLQALRTQLMPEDLFQAGDSFSLQSHHEFFLDGKLDDGTDFPYTIEVVSVGEEAVVRVTRTK